MIHNITQLDTFGEAGYVFQAACTCGDFTARVYGQPSEMTAQRVIRLYEIADKHRARAIEREVLQSMREQLLKLDGCTCDAPNGLHFVPCQWASAS